MLNSKCQMTENTENFKSGILNQELVEIVWGLEIRI